MNSYGNKFRVQLFGESHGPAIGVTIDGVPPGIPLCADDFREDLKRRSGGKKGGTPRVEADSMEFLSGIFKGYTTGAPLSIIVRNLNTRSEDYDNLADIPRPGHADYTSMVRQKGFSDPRGGGHHSGRVTLSLVIAGVIAKKITAPSLYESTIISIGGEPEWEKKLESAIEKGDSLGGVIECSVKNVPAGLGEPFFDSVESCIAHLVFAIPGIRGIEFGDGFKAASMWGSQHNDPIIHKNGKTARNASGGINGGITNGNTIVFRVAAKPTSSISLPQHTLNIKSGAPEELRIKGRHDACFALRVPVILESVAAIAIADFIL
jgi:chorismate synthase